MTIEQLVSDYGLLAIFGGCFLEGETFAITGGVLAHHGLLILWQVAAAVIAGAFLADCAWFLFARRFRSSAIVRSLIGRPRVAKLFMLVDRHPKRLVCLCRFLPGMRILGPVVLAQSRIRTVTFVLLAALSALVWGTFYALMGQAVSELLVALIGRGRHAYLLAAGVILLALLVGSFLWRRWVRSRTAG